MNRYIKILPLIICILLAFSCNKKLDQKDMFHGRATTNKKKGHYDTGVRRSKPMSVQLAEANRKETKEATDPRIQAKKEDKELKKKKANADRERAKHNKKVRQKVETTKGKPTGGGN